MILLLVMFPVGLVLLASPTVAMGTVVVVVDVAPSPITPTLPIHSS